MLTIANMSFQLIKCRKSIVKNRKDVEVVLYKKIETSSIKYRLSIVIVYFIVGASVKHHISVSGVSLCYRLSVSVLT